MASKARKIPKSFAYLCWPLHQKGIPPFPDTSSPGTPVATAGKSSAVTCSSRKTTLKSATRSRYIILYIFIKEITV